MSLTTTRVKRAKLVRRLDDIYPDWRNYHRLPEEAAVEIGLLDESSLAASDYPELDFSDKAAYKRLADFDFGDDYD